MPVATPETKVLVLGKILVGSNADLAFVEGMPLRLRGLSRTEEYRA